LRITEFAKLKKASITRLWYTTCAAHCWNAIVWRNTRLHLH